jgi:hypothetical protein
MATATPYDIIYRHFIQPYDRWMDHIGWIPGLDGSLLAINMVDLRDDEIPSNPVHGHHCPVRRIPAMRILCRTTHDG